jgi:hypothetical protein
MVETRQQAKAREEQEANQTTTALHTMPDKNTIFQAQTSSIEFFTGASTQNTRQWIAHAVNILEVQGFTDPTEVKNLMIGFFRGEALDWVNNNKDTLSDWNTLRNGMIERFPAPPAIHNTFEYFQQLSNRRQGIDESTVDY